MAISQMNGVIHQLRKLALAHDRAEKTDGQLLECFVSRREEAALEALVVRHGPMVWVLKIAADEQDENCPHALWVLPAIGADLDDALPLLEKALQSKDNFELASLGPDPFRLAER